LAGFFVEWLGGHVQAVVGPDDRAEFNGDPSEALRVAQRLEHALPLGVVERDVADGAVLEGQPQLMVADDLDRDDGNKLFHALSLQQGVDRIERLFAENELPVRLELGGVQLGPVLNEAQCVLGQRADDDLARDVERGSIASLLRNYNPAGLCGAAPR
jgi:hypothetical protein